MPRAITTAMLDAMSSQFFQPAFFVQIQLSTGTVYLWTGIGPISWNSQTWSGDGSLLSVGNQIEDAATVEARGMAITISGLNPTLLASMLGDVQLGLPIIVWLADMSGGAPTDSPLILWGGAVDQPTVDVSGSTSALTINCENLLVSMNVPADRRYTQQDQQALYPGDLGCNFVTSCQEITIFWGVATTTNNV